MTKKYPMSNDLCNFVKSLTSLVAAGVFAIATVFCFPLNAQEIKNGSDNQAEKKAEAKPVEKPATTAAADPNEIIYKLEPKLVKLFDPYQFPIDAKKSEPKLEYRLFKPKMDQNKKYPLIIWLHGNGPEEHMYKNYGQLLHLDRTIFTDLDNRDKYPFFCLVPQLVDDHKSWFTALDKNDTQTDQTPIRLVDLLFKIVEKLEVEYPIDPDRISLVGISSAATEGWEIVSMKPDKFSAFVSMASFRSGFDKFDKLEKISIWSFHGRRDKPESAEQLISKLNEAGGWGRMTVTDSHTHNCWRDAFMHYDLLSWQLDQKRGVINNNSWSWREWKYTGMTYWPQFTGVGAILLVIIAVKKERLRKIQLKLAEGKQHTIPAS